MGKKGVRDPSSHRTPEQIKQHYKDYQGKPENIAKRSERNKARRIMVAKHGEAAVKGKDVDHKTPIRKGGGNSPSNLRIRDRKTNRGWEREKK